MKTALTDLLGIELPIIMAPMFLVTNVDMIVAAGESGIAGCRRTKDPTLSIDTDYC